MKINKILHQMGGAEDAIPTTGHEALAHVAEMLSRPSLPRRLNAMWLTPRCIACGRGQPGRVEVRGREGYVPVHFNHLAVAAKYKQAIGDVFEGSTRLPQPTSWGPFLGLSSTMGVRLDYAEPGVEFPGQHYALLVSDDVFGRAVERIKSDGVQFWADPGHTPGEINTRSTPTTAAEAFYLDDPSGHHLELITQPHGADQGAPVVRHWSIPPEQSHAHRTRRLRPSRPVSQTSPA